MPLIRHGRMDLHWCDSCNVPLITRGDCPACGMPSREVAYTPPGDVRPAFPFDVDQVRSLADSQWGSGMGGALLPDDSPIVMNPSPSPERLDEVIASGHVACSLTFSPNLLRHILLLRMEGARRMNRSGVRPSRGFVISDPMAALALFEGKNLMCPGILDADRGIALGDEVLVLDVSGAIIGSGIAKKPGGEMVGTRDVGVKVRWAARTDAEPTAEGKKMGETAPKDWKEAWEHTISVNSIPLAKKAGKAVSFIKKAIQEAHLPPAVSFSGGKDSLATLLLVMDAGLRPPVMFVDTGIEFPETVEYVHSIIKELGLALFEGRPNSSFFDDLKRFGPPGRDFRWCCKSCKLGPTTRLIEEHFPEGVLTFIGQRRFESNIREKKGALWKNPWVPKQTSASPVQDWTALDVWLYIFGKKVRYNPLYEKGFNRIGCWLCPSSNLSEREALLQTEADVDGWDRALEEERARRGLPKEWITYGFHRFKKAPPYMKRLSEELSLPEALRSDRPPDGREQKAVLDLVEGYGTCIDGISKEGMANLDAPFERIANLLSIIGATDPIDDDLGAEARPPDWGMKRHALELYRDGTVVIRGRTPDEIGKIARDLASVLKRASGCIGCGICIGRCPRKALHLDQEGIIELDATVCIHCEACLGPCPAEAFEMEPF